MPDLASLTDYDPVVDQPIIADPARRIPVYKDDDPPVVEQPSKTSVAINNVLNKLFRDDDQRYQLWPEKVVREAITGAHDIGTGESPRWAIDSNTGDVHTSPQMVEKAQAISALAGTGGLGGVTDATLGATPFLRPALKYKDKLYKGKEGQQHMDVIPEHLYPEFQDMAMKGEDISHYNFGFYNDKGQFLNREKALEYGINTGLIDPQAGKFGALTSTMGDLNYKPGENEYAAVKRFNEKELTTQLLADSSKPGTAIEALAKTSEASKIEQIGKALWTRRSEMQSYKPAEKLENAGEDKFYIKDVNGKELGRVAVQPSEDGKTIKIIHMQAGSNSLGTASIRSLKAQLKEHYPDATRVEGFRVGGANPNRDLNVLLADSTKPGMVIESQNKKYKFTPVDHEPEFK